MLGSHQGIWSTIANLKLDNSQLTKSKSSIIANPNLNSFQQTESDISKINPIVERNTNTNLTLDDSISNPANFYPSKVHENLVTGYSELVTSRIQKRWSCDLLTIVFDQLASQPQSIQSRMRDEVQKIYSILLTRVNRYPKKASTDDLPILVGALDLPVNKSTRANAPLVRCNDGLHFHGLLLIPPASRLKVTAKQHFEANADLYISGPVQRIHVKPISTTPERAVDYVLKTIRNGRIAYDDGILILPRARTEI